MTVLPHMTSTSHEIGSLDDFFFFFICLCQAHAHVLGPRGPTRGQACWSFTKASFSIWSEATQFQESDVAVHIFNLRPFKFSGGIRSNQKSFCPSLFLNFRSYQLRGSYKFLIHRISRNRNRFWIPFCGFTSWDGRDEELKQRPSRKQSTTKYKDHALSGYILKKCWCDSPQLLLLVLLWLPGSKRGRTDSKLKFTKPASRINLKNYN